MANHDDTGQQDALDSSTGWTPNGEQAPEQEGRFTGQGESEQSHQGIVPAQEAVQEHMRLHEHAVPQGEVGTPPEGALEPDSPTSDHQDDGTPSSAPEEQPEREVVPVPAARLEAEGEEPLNQQAG